MTIEKKKELVWFLWRCTYFLESILEKVTEKQCFSRDLSFFAAFPTIENATSVFNVLYFALGGPQNPNITRLKLIQGLLHKENEGKKQLSGLFAAMKSLYHHMSQFCIFSLSADKIEQFYYDICGYFLVSLGFFQKKNYQSNIFLPVFCQNFASLQL